LVGATPTLVTAASGAAPLRIISPWRTHPLFTIVAEPSITDAPRLKGKKVGVAFRHTMTI